MAEERVAAFWGELSPGCNLICSPYWASGQDSPTVLGFACVGIHDRYISQGLADLGLEDLANEMEKNP